MNISQRLLGAVALCALAPTSLATQGSTLRYYVRSDAPNSNGSGTSWSQAFKYLQDALDEAETTVLGGCGCEVEVWVKQGTYFPDRSRFNPTGSGNRDASFELLDEVAIYGGFDGTESMLSQREPMSRSTLSGQIGSSPTQYSIHVVDGSFGSTIDERRSVLDGFDIRFGYCADQFSPENRGAGIHVSFARALIANCRVFGNVSDEGAGASCDEGGDVYYVNTEFVGNSATDDGGAYFQGEGRTLFAQCVFRDNTAGDRGGAITHEALSASGVLRMTSCTFLNNSANTEGSDVFMRGSGSDLLAFNSIFWSVAPIRVTESASLDLRGPVVRGGSAGVSIHSSGSGTTSSLLANDPLFSVFTPGEPAHNAALVNAGLPNSLSQDVADLDNDGNRTEGTPLDFRYRPRIAGGTVDRGAYETINAATTSCVPTVNTTGLPGILSVYGSNSVADGTLALQMNQVPNNPGIVFFGTLSGNVVVGDGRLCISGTIVRMGVAFGSGNTANFELDFSESYGNVITPGTTRYFSFWYRDVGTAGFKFTDAVQVMFVQ